MKKLMLTLFSFCFVLFVVAQSQVGNAGQLQQAKDVAKIKYLEHKDDKAQQKLDQIAPVTGLPWKDYVYTGDPMVDAANYFKAKSDWIAANPQAYQDMMDSGTTGTKPDRQALLDMFGVDLNDMQNAVEAGHMKVTAPTF